MKKGKTIKVEDDANPTIVTGKTKDQKKAEQDKKRKKISKGYYNIPEDEIQEIIKRAKEGSTKDQAYLLKVFHNFLEKYVNMLSNDRFDLRDYDIKCFVKLYIGDKTLSQKLSRDSLNLTSYHKVIDNLKGITYMIQRYNDEHDVRQTVHLSFTECVMRYERRGSIPFSGFLYRYFFFILKKNVDALLIDQLGLKSFPLITDDAVGSSYDRDMDNAQISIPEAETPLSPSAEDFALNLDFLEIDENWIHGDGAVWPFNELLAHERQLIKWRYVDGLKPNRIAEKTSDHPNTCRQHIRLVTEKIKALLEEEDQYFYS